MNTLISPVTVIIAVIVALLLIFLCTGYLKAPPDTALIISGLKRRELIGGAGFRIPILERVDRLSLKLIPIDVKTSNAVPTADYININVDAAVNVKISANKELLDVAAQNFLNKKVENIAAIAKEVLEGNMREIVGKMKLEEMVSDRQKFANLVTENAKPDLRAMGLEIISFNVQNFADNNNVIENLGIDNTEAIRKKAAIAKAESQRDIAIAEAAASKDSNEAKVLADTEIAVRQNELAIKRSELKIQEDTKKAEADAAYEIQKETQRRTIEVTRQEADIAKAEKEVTLREKLADAEERQLDAEVRKKAEADRYARQQKADADLYTRQRDAEAKLYEDTKKAEASKRHAEAELFQAQRQAEARAAEADGIKAIGDAEASAIAAKGMAEATAMEKKAEAYQKYNNIALAEMLVQVLPEVAAKIAEPLTKIDKITIIGGDSSGVDTAASNVPTVMAKAFESVKAATGIDLSEIVKAESYGAKVNRNVSVSGLPEHTVSDDISRTVIPSIPVDREVTDNTGYME